MKKEVLNRAENIMTILCIIIISLSIFQVINNKVNPKRMPTIGGYRLMPVLTGSMQPVLRAGDMIMTGEKSPYNVKVGDIITFRMDDDIYVAHRVIEIVNTGEDRAFKTKGDANDVSDRELVKSNRLAGILIFKIPYGGYIAGLLRNWTGIILLMITPLVLLKITA